MVGVTAFDLALSSTIRHCIFQVNVERVSYVYRSFVVVHCRIEADRMYILNG